jgi:putative membrane protein
MGYGLALRNGRLGIPLATVPFLLTTGGGMAAETTWPADFLTLCLATVPEASPERIWTEWSFAPAVVIPLALLSVLYVRGLMVASFARGDQTSSLRRWLFAAGLACLVIALVSPLCRMASTLAWAHMIQHVLLVAGAPLLLALSRPGQTLLAHLPALIHIKGSTWQRFRGDPQQQHACLLVTCVLYAVNIWVWHIPALYEAALQYASVHLLMITSLLVISLAFWHAVLETYRSPGPASGLAAMLLFFTFMHTAALGIFLTFSTRPWYPLMALRSGAWGILPLDDQRLAGLIMWIPMGGIYVAVALAAVARLIICSRQATEQPSAMVQWR